MISFVKLVAIISAVFVAAAAVGARAADGSTPLPETKQTVDNTAKKNAGGAPAETPAPKKKMDVPVMKGHDSFGLHIPYFDGTGRRQMNFTIGVASRIDGNHIRMKNLQIETLNEDGEHEMTIDVPTSVFDTDTSVITTNKHVTIRREDFELAGEAMIFNTQTKLGGLGGGVRMIIYNLKEETDGPPEDQGSKADTAVSKDSTPKLKENTQKPKAK